MNTPEQDYVAEAPFGAVPADAAGQGQWSDLMNWPALAIHSVLLPDGQVMAFGGNTYPDWPSCQG